MSKIRVIYLIAWFLCFYYSGQAGLSSKFKVYFNHPVNDSVSSGTPAIFVNGTVMDTLISYINSAKYSIDVAQYDYDQSSNYSNVANAVNNAYTRGVRVRWIHDGYAYNNGIALLNTGIHTLGSPTTGNYGIMHDKFVIIDANSPDSTEAWLHTTSMDWNSEMVDSDYNNYLFIQSRQLAQAYTVQFNEMWGDTGAAPNNTTSKFGPYKTDSGPQSFTIDGITVELYFSPTDGTNSKIIDVINSANSQLFFGVYCITEGNDASAIISRYNAGVSTYGIVDQYTQQASGGQYGTLSAGLGNNLKVYSQPGSIYHNKLMLVDACDAASDPQVLTGSHNWTKSADEYNDENTLIIHDATITNMYYQSFFRNFEDVSGQMQNCVSATGIAEVSAQSIEVYPNPTEAGYWQVTVDANMIGGAWQLLSLNGQLVAQSVINATQMEIPANVSPGFYLIKINSNGQQFVRKAVKM